MLFQTQAFLLFFLPATLAVWYAAASKTRLREWTLIFCSFVFYGWWDIRFIPLLAGQIVLSWLAARIFFACRRRPRWLLVAAISANLSVLVFFKYWAFLATNLLLAFGIDLPRPNIVLPIGISFYTFEIISYLADAAWREAPAYPFRRFTLFVSLFPRLIAGPIVRHHEIVPQFNYEPWREGLAERLSKGAVWLIIGLVKKVFLADALAPIANAHFAAAASTTLSFGSAWSGALAFSLQLFLDFSAYSEMAIGVALMLGFTLPQNFDAPYRAVGLRDFWRRWHMTLSRYLRDYVYIPLGGSRSGEVQYIAAILVTMALCGLWHGAGWTFLVWGLLHGAGLILAHLWHRHGWPLPDAAAWLLTLLFVIAGWVVFRAPNLSIAAGMLKSMVGVNGFAGPLEMPVLIATAFAVSLLSPTTLSFVSTHLKPKPVAALLAAFAVTAVVLHVGDGQAQDFIYFQF